MSTMIKFTYFLESDPEDYSLDVYVKVFPDGEGYDTEIVAVYPIDSPYNCQVLTLALHNNPTIWPDSIYVSDERYQELLAIKDKREKLYGPRQIPDGAALTK
ncbi:hypothetical protein [Ammoniphilus sp. CFH 90114]|uniref:hypothetical protein n=1 Tax=Ammoniphilus sp. CFH 90114 TaxID=2493665 RepID=UPI00100DB97E|nr:hypothetical protein [Ammoniphilus sp. CFH 90114]RXT00979.1 hypothetical protein EIZ39_25640 [Ammoniphilus sp. CFH 90114]